MYTVRTTVLLSPEQRERLERIARGEGRTLSSVIREAIELHVAPPPRDRSAAAESLIAMDVPVGDWQTVKTEIGLGAMEGLPRPGPEEGLATFRLR